MNSHWKWKKLRLIKRTKAGGGFTQRQFYRQTLFLSSASSRIFTGDLDEFYLNILTCGICFLKKFSYIGHHVKTSHIVIVRVVLRLSPIPPIIPPPQLWSTIWTMFIVLHLPTGRSQDCLSLITTFHYQITKLEKAWTRSPVKVIICVVNIWISVVLSEFRHNLSDILGRGET